MSEPCIPCPTGIFTRTTIATEPDTYRDDAIGVVSRRSKSKLTSALIIALCTNLLGIGLTATQRGQQLFDSYELEWLFKLRGPKPAPEESIIVAIDKNSARDLDLPFDTIRWPRTQHAKLVNGLTRAGARTIVFDLHFKKSRPTEDSKFANAIKNAGNVLLPEFLDPCVPNEEDCQSNLMASHQSSPDITLYERTLPTTLLAHAAAAVGPFTLSDTNRRVNQFWTIDPYAGDAPSLPLLALLHFASKPIDFKDSTEAPTARERPPHESTETQHDTNQFRDLADTLVHAFRNTPQAAHQETLDLSARETLSPDNKNKVKISNSILAAVKTPAFRYLNFYGPANSIHTIRFDQALELLDANNGNNLIARATFGGKAVFVGLSSGVQRDQRENFDYFDTVYSDQDTGSKLSGVEILATGFSNLLHQETVRPLAGLATLLIITLCGLTIAFCAQLLTPLKALAVVGTLSTAYLATAVNLFDTQNIWLPLLVPLTLQVPISLFAATLIHHRHAAREYRIIHGAFNRYLPDIAINRLVHEGFHPIQDRETLFGVCLFTDAEDYTRVAETIQSDELTSIEEDYKKNIENVVIAHHGCVSDSHGDSVLAFWASRIDELANRHAACEAALAIDAAVEHWNETNAYGIKFPTRIGLHCGELTLTRIGSETAYESRLVGDIVNTASRLENLNKHLGTRKLASAETLNGLNNTVNQYVGKFVFKGKTKPVDVHQILGCGDQEREAWAAYMQYFSAAVAAFQAARWNEAIEYFESVITIRPNDSPARWYLQLIARMQRSPAHDFDGTIVLASKRPDE